MWQGVYIGQRRPVFKISLIDDFHDAPYRFIVSEKFCRVFNVYKFYRQERVKTKESKNIFILHATGLFIACKNSRSEKCLH